MVKTEVQPVSRRAFAVLVRGQRIERHLVEVTADMNRQTFSITLPDMQMTVNIPAGDIAGVLNEAIKQAMESEVKSDERISQTDHDAENSI